MVGNKGRINSGSVAMSNYNNHSPQISGSGLGQTAVRLVSNEKESESKSKSERWI